MYFPVDFVFDFSDDVPGVAGGTYITGQNTAFYWEAMNTTGTGPFVLDNESVAEITGIEIYGPITGTPATTRNRILYVTPVIDGKEIGTIRMNELMAPMPAQGMFDSIGFAGMRKGHAAINLGYPLLMGGDPTEATPKMGPGESLTFKLVLPATAEFGPAADAPVAVPVVVRAWIAMVKGENKLRTILEYYHGPNGTGRFNGASMNQSFQLGDLESGEMEIFDNNVGGPGGFGLGNWTELFGGSDANRPKAEPYVTYARNRQDTTPNTWYQFTSNASRVYNDWEQLAWNLTKRNAVEIRKIGVMTHDNLKHIRLYRSNRGIEYIMNVAADRNPLPMPASATTTDIMTGPGELPRKFLVWGENGSIEIRDDGTAIKAVGAAPDNPGIMVAVWGKEYEML